MNPLKQLEACGQSPWLDYLKRSLIETGRVAHAHRARRAEGRHLEPVDLREGDRRERRIRRCAEAVPGAGRPRRLRDLRASGDRRYPRRRRRAAPGLRGDAGPGRLYQPRMLALSGQRYRSHHGRGAAAVGGGRAPQSDGEGAGDPGRHSGHPPADRPRAQHQHHLALLRRASTSRWSKPISPGSRIWRGQAATSRKTGSVASFFVSRIDSAIDKRLDQLGDNELADRLRGKAAIANAKLAYVRYKALFSGPRWQHLAGVGREDAAPALGFHQHQESGLQGHDVCRGADRPRHRGHHPAGDDGCLPRPRRGDARCHRAGRGGRPARCSPSWSGMASR